MFAQPEWSSVWLTWQEFRILSSIKGANYNTNCPRVGLRGEAEIPQQNRRIPTVLSRGRTGEIWRGAKKKKQPERRGRLCWRRGSATPQWLRIPRNSRRLFTFSTGNPSSWRRLDQLFTTDRVKHLLIIQSVTSHNSYLSGFLIYFISVGFLGVTLAFCKLFFLWRFYVSGVLISLFLISFPFWIFDSFCGNGNIGVPLLSQLILNLTGHQMYV